MEIVELSIKDLKAAEYNPRRLTKDQAARLEESLSGFGVVEPAVINMSIGRECTIVGGHQRIRIAKRLGLKTFPCVLVDLSLEKERELNVRLNKNTGEFDFDMLANHFNVEELLNWGFNQEELKIDVSPLGAGLIDEDELPEEVAVVASKLGDLWQLGNHRIVCGDSTNPAHVDKLLAGVKPHLMVTDPPYGVNYDASWREGADLGVGERSKGKVINDNRADWTEAYALFPGDVAYTWCAPGDLQCTARDGLVNAGFEIKQQIIWVKQHFVLGRGHYHYQHEPCWYAVRKKAKGIGKVIASNPQSGKSRIITHSAMARRKKPSVIARRNPLNVCAARLKTTQALAKLFTSRSPAAAQLITACEQTERHCYAIEIFPAYVDMAVRRWQAFTGQKAVNLETGEEFDKVYEKAIKARSKKTA
jgi:DNA modification methylase